MDLPPLPEVLLRPANTRNIRPGCWIISTEDTSGKPEDPWHFCDGSLRIEETQHGARASGDLYKRPFEASVDPVGHPPDPTEGIPVQRRSQYHRYVVVSKINHDMTLAADEFELELKFYDYQKARADELTARFFFSSLFQFDPESEGITYKAKLKWTTDGLPHDLTRYPSPNDCAVGSLTTEGGAPPVKFTMAWVSDYYRKCSLEIDYCNGCPIPLGNNDAVSTNWKAIFDVVGWNVDVNPSRAPVQEKPGDHDESLSVGELYSAMARFRSNDVDLDANWTYYLFTVPEFFEIDGYGVMFNTSRQADFSKKEGVRRGSAIRAELLLDNDHWGDHNGRPFAEAKAAYFRTAVHEIGHAMGLGHGDGDGSTKCSLMEPTETLLEQVTPEKTFDSLIEWTFSDVAVQKLRHWPDYLVRPGGTELGLPWWDDSLDGMDRKGPLPIPGLTLEITPLLKEVPLGAPVRVDVTLRNASKESIKVPAEISLESGNVSGIVRTYDGVARAFQSPISCDRTEKWTVLKPNESISESMNLFHGHAGALFQASGMTNISIGVQWRVPDSESSTVVKGRTTVTILQPVDSSSHAILANRVLTTPGVSSVVDFGDDHATEGIAVVHDALKDPILQPHFATIEAKRLARKFFGRPADPEGAQRVLDDAEFIAASAVEEERLARFGLELKGKRRL